MRGSAFGFPQSAFNKCPRQESNLVLDLRRVACESGTLQGHVVSKHLARESKERLAVPKTAVLPSHSQGILFRVARPGIEPGPTASEADMRSSTPTGHVFVFSIPTWNRTKTWTLGESRAVRYTIEAYGADDWIRTSMSTPFPELLARAEPFSVEPRRHVLVPTL